MIHVIKLPGKYFFASGGQMLHGELLNNLSLGLGHLAQGRTQNLKEPTLIGPPCHGAY
jgi:hypothetical protein